MRNKKIVKSLDDFRNVNFYEKLLKKHGNNFKALNWGNSDSQACRFRVLADIGLNSGDKVLDVGCGLSDFYVWLKKNKKGVLYTGLDLTPSMIEKSKKRFPKIEFIEGSIFNLNLRDSSFDYIFASGIFFLRKSKPTLYLKKTIKKMFALSKKGIAFNTLSLWNKNFINQNEYRADPVKIIKFCKTLTDHLVFRHDYHKGDFTIYMYHKKLNK